MSKNQIKVTKPDGTTFIFQNPNFGRDRYDEDIHWDWKALGIDENKQDKDGYNHAAKFVHVREKNIKGFQIYSTKITQKMFNSNKGTVVISVDAQTALIAEEMEKELRNQQKIVNQQWEDSIQDDTMITITEIYYNGHHIYAGGDYFESKKVKAITEKLNDLGVRKTTALLQPYLSDSVEGEYGSIDTWTLTFAQLKGILDTLEQEKKQKEETAKQIEQEKMSKYSTISCKKIKETKQNGDTASLVEITDGHETLQFMCRNIFDFGYVINPNYKLLPALEKGGMPKTKEDGTMSWQDFTGDKGWYEVRDMTDLEQLAIQYLYDFPPIGTSIRMCEDEDEQEIARAESIMDQGGIEE